MKVTSINTKNSNPKKAGKRGGGRETARGEPEPKPNKPLKQDCPPVSHVAGGRSQKPSRACHPSRTRGRRWGPETGQAKQATDRAPGRADPRAGSGSQTARVGTPKVTAENECPGRESTLRRRREFKTSDCA